MPPPRKPFPSYKWRWATVTPTESLNQPVVLLGVLRVLRNHEGQKPSSQSVHADLDELSDRLRVAGIAIPDLSRARARNLIRNSGQYWKALGLYAESRGRIALTNFGQRVSDGDIPSQEFAATVVRTLQLPNLFLRSNAEEWDRVGLVIKPLELILRILVGLADRAPEAAFVTPRELVEIIIPLAGSQSSVARHVGALLAWRAGLLDTTGWPDCAPGANDRRMAREFLLFLYYHNFCRLEGPNGNTDQRFLLTPAGVEAVRELLAMPAVPADPGDAAAVVRPALGPLMEERTRRRVEVLHRPGQASFRRKVLAAQGRRCLLSGVDLEAALEAAHIVPVEHGGPDSVGNGLTLRSDLHALFDAGHIRISAEGEVRLSERCRSCAPYQALPGRVAIPRAVSAEALEWRWNHL